MDDQPEQLPYPGPPSSVSILDPDGNTVLCIIIREDGRLDVTGDPARWTDAARLFLDGLRHLAPPVADPGPAARRIDDVDRYTIDRAQALASAVTDGELRSWFRMTPGEAVPLAASYRGEPLARAALVVAQDLLGCLARLAERPDQPGTLDYLAATVAAMHTTLTGALTAMLDDAPIMPALTRLGDQIDNMTRLLPPPVLCIGRHTRPAQQARSRRSTRLRACLRVCLEVCSKSTSGPRST